jgi:hypothetical protein
MDRRQRQITAPIVLMAVGAMVVLVIAVLVITRNLG